MKKVFFENLEIKQNIESVSITAILKSSSGFNETDVKEIICSILANITGITTMTGISKINYSLIENQINASQSTKT